MKLPEVHVEFYKWWDDYKLDIIRTANKLKDCGVDEEVIDKFITDNYNLIAKEALEFTIRHKN
jgi:hypothetical protein